MKSQLLKQITAALVIASFATAAAAQYVWLDENGSKQFSDMPPPASVPKKRILKEPSRAAVAVPESASAPAGGAAASASASAKSDLPMTTAEKNADYMKRRKEQEEKYKKAEAEAKLAADKAKNCEQARKYQRSLNSGERIGSTDKNGEKSFMSDAQRAQEAQETNRILNECK